MTYLQYNMLHAPHALEVLPLECSEIVLKDEMTPWVVDVFPNRERTSFRRCPVGAGVCVRPSSASSRLTPRRGIIVQTVILHLRNQRK